MRRIMFRADRDAGHAARHAKLLPDARAHAEQLLAIADRACERASRHEPQVLWAATDELSLEVGTDYDEWGTTQQGATARQIFADAEALLAAIAGGTNVGRTLVLPLLAITEPEGATELVMEGLKLGQRDFFENFVEAWLMKSLAWSAKRLEPLLDAEEMGTLWVSGKLRLDRVTDAHIASLPVARIAEAARGTALGYFHKDDVRRVLAAHPELGSLDACVALLEALDGAVESHAACAFSDYLLSLFTRHAHSPALPIVLRTWESTQGAQKGAGGVHQAATTALFALGHRPTLEKLARELDACIARAKPTWSPHHTIRELRDPIRATFALDPEHASQRFAAYFEDVALSQDSGAKVAHDILLLGGALSTDHSGTRLGTGDPAWLDSDPNWKDVLARIAKHPRLGPIARSLLPKKARAAPKKKSRRSRT